MARAYTLACFYLLWYVIQKDAARVICTALIFTPVGQEMKAAIVPVSIEP